MPAQLLRPKSNEGGIESVVNVIPIPNVLLFVNLSFAQTDRDRLTPQRKVLSLLTGGLTVLNPLPH